LDFVKNEIHLYRFAVQFLGLMFLVCKLGVADGVVAVFLKARLGLVGVGLSFLIL
jgi:hypothetical protein